MYSELAPLGRSWYVDPPKRSLASLTRHIVARDMVRPNRAAEYRRAWRRRSFNLTKWQPLPYPQAHCFGVPIVDP
jgi:hypothetical protein